MPWYCSCVGALDFCVWRKQSLTTKRCGIYHTGNISIDFFHQRECRFPAADYYRYTCPSFKRASCRTLVRVANLQASGNVEQGNGRYQKQRRCFLLSRVFPPLPLSSPCVTSRARAGGLAGPELSGQRSHGPRGRGAIRMSAAQRHLVRACPRREHGHRSGRGETHHRGAGDKECHARGEERVLLVCAFVLLPRSTHRALKDVFWSFPAGHECTTTVHLGLRTSVRRGDSKPASSTSVRVHRHGSSRKAFVPASGQKRTTSATVVQQTSR